MTKTKLEQLYCEQQLSMAEIAKELGTTHAKVLYWLKKHEIPRRLRSESAYIKLNPTGDPFALPSKLSGYQQKLLEASLMLYWAEGSKTNGVVRIANLDARMLRVFIAFLRNVCHVHEKRLSIYVRVHKQFPQLAAKRYWSRLLSLSPEQVFVYVHTDQRSKATQQWSKHGLATLEFHNTKFKVWLDKITEKHISQLLQNIEDDVASIDLSQNESLLADESPRPLIGAGFILSGPARN